LSRPRDFRPTILPQFGIVFACSTTTGPKIFIVSRWACFKQTGAGKARCIVSNQLHPFETSSTHSKSFNPGLVFNPVWRHQTACGFTLAGNRLGLNSPWIMMIILFDLILPSVKGLFTYFPLGFFEKIGSDEYHKMYPGRLENPETHPYSSDEPGVISIIIDYLAEHCFSRVPVQAAPGSHESLDIISWGKPGLLGRHSYIALKCLRTLRQRSISTGIVQPKN